MCSLHAFSHGPSADEARLWTSASVDIFPRSDWVGPEMKSLAGSGLGLLRGQKDASKCGASASARAEPSASSNWRANLLVGPRSVSPGSGFAAEPNRLEK